jgi:hypothetical protein
MQLHAKILAIKIANISSYTVNVSLTNSLLVKLPVLHSRFAYRACCRDETQDVALISVLHICDSFSIKQQPYRNIFIKEC